MEEENQITLVNEKDLISYSQAMVFNLQPIEIVRETSFGDDAKNYEVLQQRLAKYNRKIEIMDKDSSYFRAFSHQLWSTQKYHPFVRFATIAYMKKNIDLYLAKYAEMFCRRSFADYLNGLTVPDDRGHYQDIHELVMKASCDLFSVRLERLFSYGERILYHTYPRTNEYHNEINMSFISNHADSMFLANNVAAAADYEPLSLARMDLIRESGFINQEDIRGCHHLACNVDF